jgi:hypothetical protein
VHANKLQHPAAPESHKADGGRGSPARTAIAGEGGGMHRGRRRPRQGETQRSRRPGLDRGRQAFPVAQSASTQHTAAHVPASHKLEVQSPSLWQTLPGSAPPVSAQTVTKSLGAATLVGT